MKQQTKAKQLILYAGNILTPEFTIVPNRVFC